MTQCVQFSPNDLPSYCPYKNLERKYAESGTVSILRPKLRLWVWCLGRYAWANRCHVFCWTWMNCCDIRTGSECSRTSFWERRHVWTHICQLMAVKRYLRNTLGIQAFEGKHFGWDVLGKGFSFDVGSVFHADHNSFNMLWLIMMT